MNKKIAFNVAKLLLSIKAVTFRFNPPYTYTSGLKSPIYLDNRLVMSYPKVREKIISFYIKKIKKDVGLKNVEWISATATAAIPHAAFVAAKLHLPMVYVRPTTKKYGKGNQIEGFIKKGSKVLIVEDHISTAESVAGNASAIRGAGGIVKYCITTTTYETKAAEENITKGKLKLITLTTGKLIVETAFKEGYLSKEEKKSVDLWFEDPPAWAKKVGL
ncbi:MAG: orotate phosphoribosyltransferase [Patescibacteria group bacterium]|nr:orotate phosphoribosyltransferase [Patescibacteria group bacterium]